MKTFKEISEASVLNDIDTQIKDGNKYMKKQKELQSVRDSLIYTSALWHGVKSHTASTDEWGNTPEFGDIVICKNSKNFIVGVVTEVDLKNSKCNIAAATINGLHDMVTEEDPFYDTIRSWIRLEDMIVIAKKNNAVKLLKIMTKVL